MKTLRESLEELEQADPTVAAARRKYDEAVNRLIAQPKSSPVAHPFSKWAGGKTKLLPLLDKHLPASCVTYHEPFVGGGALFWHLANGKRFSRAILSDANADLVEAYLSIRDSVEDVIAILRDHGRKHCEAHYYAVRGWHRDATDLSAPERAARFLYLNRVCFNGLYRVNSKGHFNVPYGDYKNPTICDAENLRACSRLLQGVEIGCRGFEWSLHVPRPGDVVFFDPPYLPISKTSSFTAYTEGGFRLKDHEWLRDIALDLKKRGVSVVVSNSAAPEIVELYREGFTIHRVHAARSVNSKGGGRGKIEELIIT